MSQGKYLSLEEARKNEAGATIKRFCKEHPTEGDERIFDELLGKMAQNKRADDSRHQSSKD